MVLVRFKAFWEAIVQQFVQQFLEPEERFPDSKNRLLSTMLCSGRAVHAMNPHAVFGINLADLPPGTH